MKDLHADHHVKPVRLYVEVFIALTLLMIATIGAAFLPRVFPVLNQEWWGSWIMNIIAVGIAVVKATLVVRNFMGAKFTDETTKIYVWTGFVWVTLLMIMFIDYGTRGWEKVRGWESTAPQAFPRGSYQDSDEIQPATTEKMPIVPFGQ